MEGNGKSRSQQFNYLISSISDYLEEKTTEKKEGETHHSLVIYGTEYITVR